MFPTVERIMLHRVDYSSQIVCLSVIIVSAAPLREALHPESTLESVNEIKHFKYRLLYNNVRGA